MCNCIEEIKDRIQNEIASKNSEYADLKITKVDCDGEAFIFNGSKMDSGMSIPFTAHHQAVRRKTKTTVNMIAKHCPFCGELYKQV